MDEFEKTIRETLSEKDKFDNAKAQTLRKETIQMFYDNMRNVKIVFWIFMAISLAIFIFGTWGIFYNTGRYITLALLTAIIGFNSTILIKLWYWIMNNKLNVLKEIKQLQLQIAELKDKEPPAEN